AQACFDAGVTLISPFVGRITDWHKQALGVSDFSVEDDPGVLGVRHIHALAKTHHYPTEVMAASFRHVGQIVALTGLDLMTISPQLLAELADMDAATIQPAVFDESPERYACRRQADFAWGMTCDAMASDRLADGIRRF